MNKLAISLFVALSLLVAPIAHAAGIGCEGSDCQMVEQVKKQSDSKNQDDGKVANSGHHCCCTHVSAQFSAPLNAPEPVSEQLVFYSKEKPTSSVVVGPSLKPPSHV